MFYWKQKERKSKIETIEIGKFTICWRVDVATAVFSYCLATFLIQQIDILFFSIAIATTHRFCRIGMRMPTCV